MRARRFFARDDLGATIADIATRLEAAGIAYMIVGLIAALEAWALVQGAD